MRVLMVGPWRSAAMRRHVDWAVENGIEVMVADLQRHDEFLLPSNVRRTALLPLQFCATHKTLGRNASARAIDIGALRLRTIAGRFRPHVIHSYMLGTHTNMCLRAGLRPLVVSVWGWLNGLMAPGHATNERERLRKVRNGAHTLLVENPNLLTALARLPIDPLRVACFPIGVDSTLFHPGYHEKAAAWRFALDIPAEATVLLSPRGWSSTYCQSHIMRAFAEAYHRLDRPLVLVLMGLARMMRPASLAQETLDLGRSLGVGHTIRWIPQVPYQDMPGVYALADIVVNYPRSDAFPSTLLEAAACARPVITSDLPAYRGTFIERFCRLVEPESPTALADAMVQMVTGGPVCREAHVQQARQAVLNDYEEGVQKQRLMALYHQVAAEYP